LVSGVSLAAGAIFLKENLLAPAAASVMLTAFAAARPRDSPEVSSKIFLLICAGLVLNMSGLLLGDVHYTNGDWIDFVLSAPSFTISGMAVVAMMIEYSGVRLNRILFTFFSAFSTIFVGIIYVGFFGMRLASGVGTSEYEMEMNYYLNAQLFVILAAYILISAAVYIILTRNGTMLITAETVAGGGR
jgi:hypothetical protein